MTIVPVPASKTHADLVDPGKGVHLWTILAMFRVPDDAMRQLANGRDPGPQLMDHENLVTTEGPGCYKCEQTFSPRLYFRKCTGSMEPQ